MGNVNDNTPTVVQLGGDNGSSIEAVTFEQAFGDYSNIKGRGRARRTARKVDRQQNKATKRVAKQAKKATVKAAKQERRQAKKVTKIANRQDRQAMKSQGKDARLQQRMNRRAMRRPEEENLGPVDEFETASDDNMLADNSGYDPENLGQEESSETGYSDDSGYNDDSAAETEGGYNEEVEEGDGGPIYDAEVEDEDGGDEDPTDYDEESNFVDETGANKVQVNPKVMEIVKKIEWNKELIRRLQAKIATSANQSEVQAHIDNRKTRIKELIESLNQNYSNARGGKAKAAAKAEVRAAKKEAKKELKQAIKAGRQAAKAEKKAVKAEVRAARKAGPVAGPRPMARRATPPPPKVTPVDADLDPDITADRIEIPAEDGETSEFTGGDSGLIALDQSGEFDSPQTRNFKFSNASGPDKKGFPIGKVILGLGVLALIGYGLKKAKVI